MDPVNRRSFLVHGGIGAAAAAVAAGGGLAVVSAGSAGAAPLNDDELAVLDRPVLVQVRDAATGEVELLVDDRQIVFIDRSLVANVLRASR